MNSSPQNVSPSSSSNGIVLNFLTLTQKTKNIEELSSLLAENGIINPKEIPLLKSSNWSPIALYTLVYSNSLRVTDLEAFQKGFINSLNSSGNPDIGQIFQEPFADDSSSGSYNTSRGPYARVVIHKTQHDATTESSPHNPRDLQYKELLGLGAFGAVVSALNTRTGRTYAVKIIQINFTHQHKLAINEATILQQVSQSKDLFVKYHHHWTDHDIKDVLEDLKGESITEIGQNFRILMDIYPKSLRQWITESRDSPNYFQDVHQFFNEIIQGISHLHERNPVVLHRDLKPANIMLKIIPNSSRYEAKIGDFGLSKESSGREDSLKTAGLGTQWYQSPEQLKTRLYGSPADMYSLGKILYEIHSPPRPEELQSFDTYTKRLDKDDTTFLLQYPLQGLVYRMLTRLNPTDRLEAKSLFTVLKINQLENHEMESLNQYIDSGPDEPSPDKLYLFKLLEHGTKHILTRIQLQSLTIDPLEFRSGLHLFASSLRELHLDKILFNNNINKHPFIPLKLILPHLVEFYISCDFNLPRSMLQSSSYSSHHHTLSVIQDHPEFIQSLLFFQRQKGIAEGPSDAPLLQSNVHLLYKNVTVLNLTHRDVGNSKETKLLLPDLRFLKRERLIQQMGPGLEELHICGQNIAPNLVPLTLKKLTLLRVDLNYPESFLLQSLATMSALAELRIHFKAETETKQEISLLSTFPPNLKLLCVRNATFTQPIISNQIPQTTLFTQLSQIVFDNCDLSNIENLSSFGGLGNCLEKLYIRVGLGSNPSATLFKSVLTQLDRRPFNYLFLQFNKNVKEGQSGNASWTSANQFISNEFNKELPLGDNFIFKKETQGSDQPLGHISLTNITEREATNTLYQLFYEHKFEVERDLEDIIKENESLDIPKLYGFC